MTAVVRPIDPSQCWISQSWGDWGGHPGVDYAANAGVPIRAMYDGIVIHAGPARGFGDHAVSIWYPELNVSTTYGHCRAMFVAVDDKVEAGQVVAEVGTEGDSTGNHLHAEIRPGYGAFGANPPNGSNFDIEGYLELHQAIAGGVLVGRDTTGTLVGLDDELTKYVEFMQKLGGVTVDGHWGPQTDAMYATKKWQLYLLKGDPKSFPRPNPTKPSSFVKEMQRAVFHFDAKDQDGWWGDVTDWAFEVLRMNCKDK